MNNSITCPYCHTQNEPNAKFCRNCGKSLSDSQISDSSQRQEVPAKGRKFLIPLVVVIILALVGALLTFRYLSPQKFHTLIPSTRPKSQKQKKQHSSTRAVSSKKASQSSNASAVFDSLPQKQQLAYLAYWVFGMNSKGLASTSDGSQPNLTVLMGQPNEIGLVYTNSNINHVLSETNKVIDHRDGTFTKYSATPPDGTDMADWTPENTSWTNNGTITKDQLMRKYKVEVDCKINPNAVRTKKISFL
ncbi:zinc ribbon domain-containing protein [Furfurilactobacillus cerevisiae]